MTCIATFVFPQGHKRKSCARKRPRLQASMQNQVLPAKAEGRDKPMLRAVVLLSHVMRKADTTIARAHGLNAVVSQLYSRQVRS